MKATICIVFLSLFSGCISTKSPSKSEPYKKTAAYKKWKMAMERHIEMIEKDLELIKNGKRIGKWVN